MARYTSLEDVDYKCPHDLGQVSPATPATKAVNNYAPLRKTDIAELLTLAQTAFNNRDGQGFSRIQVRFGKAIPGATCPHPIDGPVAERSTELDEFFVENARSGPTEHNVRELLRLTR
jgi:hypothetical protein